MDEKLKDKMNTTVILGHETLDFRGKGKAKKYDFLDAKTKIKNCYKISRISSSCVFYFIIFLEK